MGKITAATQNNQGVGITYYSKAGLKTTSGDVWYHLDEKRMKRGDREDWARGVGKKNQTKCPGIRR